MTAVLIAVGAYLAAALPLAVLVGRRLRRAAAADSPITAKGVRR